MAIALLLLPGGAVISSPASAQAGAAPRAVIDEIVVTARQREETLQQSPVTVTALSADAISRLALTDLEQIATHVPNLMISFGGSGGASNVSLRGIGTGPDSAGFSSAVGLVIDDAFFERGRWIQQSYFDLEQVEVLKGPQSLYYGKNTPAGLIILRSRDPGDELEGHMRVGYEGNADELLLEGGVSIPLSDTFGIRLAGRFVDQKGWMKNISDPQPASVDPLGFEIPGRAGNNRLPAREDLSGRLTALWTPNERFRANLKVELSRNEQLGVSQLARCFGPDGQPQLLFGVPTAGDDCRKNFKADFPTPPRELLESEPADFGRKVNIKWRSQIYNLRLGYDFDDFAVESVTAYQRYKVDPHLQTSANGGGQVPFYESTDYDNFSQELRIRSQFDGPLNFLGGALYTTSDLDFRNAARIAPLPPDSGTGRLWTWDKSAEEDAESYSVYGEVIWDITPELELSGGARYTREKRDFGFQMDFVHEILLGVFEQAPLVGTFKDSNVSPQVTLAWRPTERFTLFGAYREGFKSGGFDASAIPNAGETIDEQGFDSEKASGFEVGLRTRLLDDTLQFNVTAYSYTFDNLQVTALDPETITFNIQNAAKASTDGVEFDVTWATPVDGLMLRGFVNYNVAEYDDFVSACYGGQSVEAGCDGNFNPNTGRFTTQNLGGKRLPRAPKWAATLGGSYDHQGLFGTPWAGSINVDGRYFSSYNTAERAMPDSVQNAHMVLDASIRLFSPDERWTVSLIGRNLTNRVVEELGSERAFTGAGQGLPAGDPLLQRADTFIRVQRSRQLWLQLEYHF